MCVMCSVYPSPGDDLYPMARFPRRLILALSLFTRKSVYMKHHCHENAKWHGVPCGAFILLGKGGRQPRVGLFCLGDGKMTIGARRNAALDLQSTFQCVEVLGTAQRSHGNGGFQNSVPPTC